MWRRKNLTTGRGCWKKTYGGSSCCCCGCPGHHFHLRISCAVSGAAPRPLCCWSSETPLRLLLGTMRSSWRHYFHYFQYYYCCCCCWRRCCYCQAPMSFPFLLSHYLSRRLYFPIPIVQYSGYCRSGTAGCGLEEDPTARRLALSRKLLVLVGSHLQGHHIRGQNLAG